MASNQSEHVVFDRILDKVGNNGRFQNRFNILFNFVFLIFVAMPNLNLYIAMFVPEHWCYVPGRNRTRLSQEKWKSFTIPKTDETNFNNCKMYNVSYEVIEDYLNARVIDCQFGWEYNTTYFKSTIPSQEDWVCDKELHVTNTFVITRLGDLVGNFIFGQLGDIYGRLPIYYASLTILIVGKILMVFTTSSVIMFMVSAFVSSLAVTAIYQAPMVIAMEMSRPENRAYIAMLQCVGWTIAFCSIPMIMWMMGHWIPFTLVTTLPCLIFLFTERYIVESPRWLANKGKTARCLKELKKIAKVNKTTVSDELVLLIKDAEAKGEHIYGMMSLFSSWRLTKHTILLVIGWTITYLVYYVLILNVNSFGGNPFINFFWQGFSELPAYVAGKLICDKIGRRWTHIGGFVGTTLGSTAIIFAIGQPSYESITTLCAIFLKFGISLSFYAINLHALEIYPTCVRQTGLSLCGIMSNAVGPLGPYIVYLGLTVDAIYPYVIISLLSLLAAMCSLFLPETLNQELPETLAEAQEFGKHHKIWSFARNKDIK